MGNYTSWIPSLKDISNIQEKTIIELGCGTGTKTLIDKFKHVYSFEYARSKEWYDKCTGDYRDFNNWTSKFYLMDSELNNSDMELIKSGGKIRKTEDLSLFFKRLDEFIIENNVKFDVGFVDQGFHFRGETVNFLIKKEIPLIMAHDCEYPAMYGYDIVNLSNYTTKDAHHTRFYFKGA